MGNYNSCYEAHYELERKKREEQTKDDFLKLTKKLSVEGQAFLVTIIKKLDNWKVFTKLIKSLK